MKTCECSGCRTHENDTVVAEKQSGCCGENTHGHGKETGEISTMKQDIISIVLSVAISVAAVIAPDGLLKTILYLSAILTAGLPIFWRGLINILKLDLDELALLTIAVTAACIIGETPEAVMVTLLFRAGEMLEDLAVSRTRREIEAVTDIIPDNANLLLDDGSCRVIGANEVKAGDKIKIKSGERVPVDCVVISGASSADSSSLTGESAPVEIAEGDRLLSGMVNLGFVLTARAVSTSENSAAAGIVRMVRDSAAKKGVTERLISRFARIYTPAVIIVAALVAVLPPLLGFGGFSMWIGRSLVFLVASCPCALVIATPLAFFAGVGGASRQGILIKGSKYMEVLAGTKAVVFDKTGTLTTGALKVDGVYTANGASGDEVIRLAAMCESESNHPVAKAVTDAAPKAFTRADTCEEITAHGMRATTGSDEILCGSGRLMQKFAVDTSMLPPANVYVAKNGVAIGAVSVFDAPRPDASATLGKLREMGVERTVMLTGDAAASAEKTARLVGITEFHAGLLPENKVDELLRVKSGMNGGKVLFVSDGINDSPVIAAADAGIAVGSASDAAVEAADIVLLSDKLMSLPQAIGIAKRTVRLVKVNMAFALLVKFAVFALAFAGLASMWLAVFADVGVSVLSVLNSARALRFK